MSAADGMRTDQLRDLVDTEVAKKEHICSLCGHPIDGAMTGTGDGTMTANGGKGSFAHPDCYRAREGGIVYINVEPGKSFMYDPDTIHVRRVTRAELEAEYGDLGDWGEWLDHGGESGGA